MSEDRKRKRLGHRRTHTEAEKAPLIMTSRKRRHNLDNSITSGNGSSSGDVTIVIPKIERETQQSVWGRFVAFFQGVADIFDSSDTAQENDGQRASKRMKRKSSINVMKSMKTPPKLISQGPVLTPANNGQLVEKIGMDPLQMQQMQIQQQQQTQQQQQQQQGNVTPKSRSRIRAQLRSFYKLSPLTPNSRIKRY